MTIKIKRNISIIMSIFILLASFLSIVNFNKAEAELDPASKILCRFDDGQIIVNFQATDSFHYMLRSKSAVASTQDINANWNNKMLGIAGFDFSSTNESILGRPLNPTTVPENSEENLNESSEKVSAFDRFGMAGLNWSSYQGEWKYYEVNACSTQEKASPTNYGAFYEDRKEPKSTYNEVANSVDNRSIQFNKGFMSNLLTAFTDTLANVMFAITKFIVTLTIVFVGLSFTDITSVLGMLNKDGTANESVTGVFTSLFDGIFTGFVLITFLITAVYFLYKGLIKREIRLATTALIKTIAIFVIAIIMSSNPSYWIGIPNKIANFGQAIVLNVTSNVYSGDDSSENNLCYTTNGLIQESQIDLNKPDDFPSQFEQTNANMRNMIACKMWETLLFKPWVRGQFGAEYEDLYASTVNNVNSEWVGSPTVPLGGGVVEENWALFHLSTQTNAHSALGTSNTPTLVNGINSDWWRIADALSNYQEQTVTENDSEGTQQTFQEAIKTTPTSYWQSWIGNNRTERLGVAITSVFFGILGSVAPLVFGFATAIFSFGLTLLMMFAPLFLLFGTWGGRGDKIFLGWLSAVVNTVIKKIAAGLLLVLSLAFSMIIMDMVNSVGFVTSFLLMTIVSLVLVKNRNKFMNMLGNVDFGGIFDPRTKANQIYNSQKTVAKDIGKTVMSGVAGAKAAHDTGQDVFAGARTGVTRQINNKLQTSTLGREILRQEELSRNAESLARQVCTMCHMPLGTKKAEQAYEDESGNYYCIPCAEEMGIEKLYEVVAGQKKELSQKETIKTMYDSNVSQPLFQKDVRSVRSANSSWISHSNLRNQMDLQKVDDEYVWDDDSVQLMIRTNVQKVKEDFVVFKNLQSKLGNRMNPPSPPEPLAEYIDLALINDAWIEGRIDVIDRTYKEAWKIWYEDNVQLVSNVSQEQVDEFLEQIDTLDFNISENRSIELVEKFLEEEGIERDSELVLEQDVYSYVNGELVLTNRDIKRTDELLSED